MKALITGGAGFIASNLVKLLLAEGHEVTVLDDLSTGTLNNLRGCQVTKMIVGDVTDARTVYDATAGMDVVFHLAASVGNSRSLLQPWRDATINVLGTLNVLEAARWHGVRKVVFSSSAGIFGQLKTLPIAEDHPCEPDSPYGCSKLCAEKLCLAYARLYAMQVVCLRYFNVYGPNQRYDAYGNVIPIFARQILRNEPLTIYGDGKQTRDFVSVHDVARANLLAATTDCPSGAYNIGSGIGIRINHLAAMMNATEIVHTDPRAGDVLHSVANISKAKAAFGYEPSAALADGLAEYLEWYKEQAA